MSFLIASFPRSGTHHITQVLQTAGANIAHERPGLTPGLVSWPHSLTWEADIVVQQVRHPFDVVRTCERAGLCKEPNTPWKQFLLPNIKTNDLPPGEKDGALRCLMSWVRWNRAIEARRSPRMTYRIEDISLNSPEMLKLFRTLRIWDDKRNWKGSWPPRYINANSAKYHRLTLKEVAEMCNRWNNYLFTEFVQAAVHYGYDLVAEERHG